MANKRVELNEGARVEQQLNALAREPFTAVALARNRALVTGMFRQIAEFFGVRKLFGGRLRVLHEAIVTHSLRARHAGITKLTSRALVTGVFNQFALVRIDGVEHEATIAGRLRHARPIVGDDVEVRTLPDGSVRIEAIGERRGTLLRGGFRGREQLVAVNVDLLVIVASAANPPLRSGLIDRYLVAAWRGGIQAALALTKLDLPHDESEVAQVRATLTSLGHAIVEVNPKSGAGVDAVRALIGEQTAVLSGHSGVGKTTLSNRITQRDDAVGEINEVIGRGRQTTTLARHLPLTGGGALIDTAGIRSFGIAGVSVEQLQDAFPELVIARPDCEYLDCLHEQNEDGCAAPAHATPARLASYRKMLEELREL